MASDILKEIEQANNAFAAYVKKQVAKENALQAALQAANANAPAAQKKSLFDYGDNDFLNMQALATILNVSLPTARAIARQFNSLTRFNSGKRAHFYVAAGEVKDFLEKRKAASRG